MSKCLHNYVGWSCPYCENDKLRAELEQWKRDYEKVNVLNDSIAASVMQEVATRCAEVIRRSVSRDGAIEAIRKEYDLEP